MGNHEFCEDCGESDFHHGRPCDPTKVAARQKARESKEERQDLEELEKALSSELIKEEVKADEEEVKARFWTNDYDILYQSWIFQRNFFVIANAQGKITDELFHLLDKASMDLKPYWGD